MRISCDDCIAQHTSACDDCVVTVLLDRPEEGAVVLDLAQERALRRLHDAGLAPANRFSARGDGCATTGAASADGVP